MRSIIIKRIIEMLQEFGVKLSDFDNIKMECRKFEFRFKGLGSSFLRMERGDLDDEELAVLFERMCHHFYKQM